MKQTKLSTAPVALDHRVAKCTVCDQYFLHPRRQAPHAKSWCCSRRCYLRLGAHAQGKFIWDQETDELLRKLHEHGLTTPEIAELMGFSRGAVDGRLFRLSLYGSRSVLWTEEEDEVLRTLAKDFGNAEIGALLSRTAGAVSGRLAKLEIQRSSEWFLARGISFHAYPPELKEVILLSRKLKRKLRDEEHRRSA